MKSLSDIVINADLTVDTNTLYVDSTNNRVGIRTTSPAHPLNVVGDAYIQAGNIHISQGSYRIKNASAGTQAIGFPSSGNFAFENVNVGIGTTSPATLLHINNGSASANSFRIENSDGYGQITTDSNVLTYDAQQHLFNNRARSSEYMRINSSGNVLIGTTTDSGAKLEVAGSVGNFKTTGHQIFLTRNGNNEIYAVGASSVLALGTNSAEKMRITSSGNVGIGETSVDARLHITSSGAAVNQKFESSGVAAWRMGIPNGQTYFAFDNTADALTSPKVAIASTGNVGIGTSSPNAPLHIQEAVDSLTTVKGITLSTSAGGTNKYLPAIVWSYGANGTPDFAKIEAQRGGNTSGRIAFSTANSSGTMSEAMRIDEGGNVGIGTSSPSDILSINSSSSDTIIHLTNTSTGTTTADGLRLGMVGTNAYFLLRESASMLFQTNNTERMRITNGGNVLIGTTTDSGYKLDVNGTSTFRDDLDMRTNAIDFKTSGSSVLPQFYGHRSATDLDSRDWASEGGWAYTTFDSSSSNTPGGSLHNANGLLSFNTHIGEYGHQIAMTTNTNKLYFRTRNAGAWQSWEEIITNSKDFIPSTDSTYDIGSSSVRFANGYFDTLHGDGSNLTNITITSSDVTTALGYTPYQENTALSATTGTFSGDITVNGNQVITLGSNADVKFSVWSGTTYGIGMTSGVTYGGLNDYAMTFCMNNEADRGFWWGYSGQSKSSGAMSLTTSGHLTVEDKITTSKSEIDITPTSDTIALDIRGTGTPNDFFTVSNATGGANDVFLPVFFYKAATYGYNGGTNRYPSGVYGGGFVAAVDDTSYPNAAGAGAAMHFNARTYANNGPLTNRYLFSWGSWLTTHMAMTAGGNLLIGKTSDSGEKLQVNGSADVSGDINADGDFYQNGTQGYTGTVTIQQPSPLPPINIDIQGGIITNVT